MVPYFLRFTKKSCFFENNNSFTRIKKIRKLFKIATVWERIQTDKKILYLLMCDMTILTYVSILKVYMVKKVYGFHSIET